MARPYRFSGWNFSYFSAKVRAYLRYKQFHGAFEYEEILASQEVIQGVMVPAIVPTTPKQKVASYLVELLADEWMLQRLADAMETEFSPQGDSVLLDNFLGLFKDGTDLLDLKSRLADCKIEKNFEQLTAV